MPRLAPPLLCLLHLLALQSLGHTAAHAAEAAPPPASAAAAASPQVWTNSLGMRFVAIPAGEFMMGSEDQPERLAQAYPKLELERFSLLQDEGPMHRVRITKPFWMGQHEVTVGQWRRFLQASGHVPESVADGTGGYGFNPAYDPSTTQRGDAFEGRNTKYSWQNPGFAQRDDHPVVNVTWFDAQAMADWLSRTEGRRYRLPTEAEWEYSCRAGSRSRYSSGDAPESLSGHANVFDEDSAKHWPHWQDRAIKGRDGHSFTAPVGSFAPNAWGLYDMHGNVWEWVADWHGDDYYAQSPVDDPQGPAEGSVRVRRGGSWHTWPFYARSAYRNWNDPHTRYTLVGFRLVRE